MLTASLTLDPAFRVAEVNPRVDVCAQPWPIPRVTGRGLTFAHLRRGLGSLMWTGQRP